MQENDNIYIFGSFSTKTFSRSHLYSHIDCPILRIDRVFTLLHFLAGFFYLTHLNLGIMKSCLKLLLFSILLTLYGCTDTHSYSTIELSDGRLIKNADVTIELGKDKVCITSSNGDKESIDIRERLKYRRQFLDIKERLKVDKVYLVENSNNIYSMEFIKDTARVTFGIENPSTILMY